jgi:hypothetical protein
MESLRSMIEEAVATTPTTPAPVLHAAHVLFRQVDQAELRGAKSKARSCCPFVAMVEAA